MIKKVLVLVLVSMVINVGVVGATASWEGVSVGVSKLVETSQGVTRLATVIPINENAAKAMMRGAAAGTLLTAGSEIIGLAALGVGIYYTAMDLEKLWNWCKSENGVSQLESMSVVNPAHPEWDSKIYNWHVTSHQYSGTAPTRVLVTISPTKVLYSTDTSGPYHTMTTGDNEVQSADVVQYYNSVRSVSSISGFYAPVTYRYVHEGGATHTTINNYIYNNAAIDNAVHNNPAKFQDPSLVEPEITTTAPNKATNYDLGKTPGYQTTDPATSPGEGEKTDPATGLPVEPTVTNSLGVLRTPGQPGVGAMDTTVTPPDTKEIGGLLTEWLSHAPFMAIIQGFTVEGSSGQSSFSIPLPQVLGGTATMDFGEFSFLWAMIATIIIGISYIYGAMIIFGGKT